MPTVSEQIIHTAARLQEHPDELEQVYASLAEDGWIVALDGFDDKGVQFVNYGVTERSLQAWVALNGLIPDETKPDPDDDFDDDGSAGDE